MNIVTLDIETTGIPPKNAVYENEFMQYPYIVSLAYKVRDGESKEFIINQEGRKIPPEVTAIHGITDEMCAASPHNLLSALFELLVDSHDTELTVGHNIYFDSSIIKANVLRLIK